MDEILHEFLVESHENLDQLDLDLVALERDPGSRPLLASVFRTIHTIKGTSGFLAFTKLERLTHVGEGLLSRLRDGELELTGDITSVLLELVDAVRAHLVAIEQTGAEAAEDHADLTERLAACQQLAGAASAGSSAAAPARSSTSPATNPATDGAATDAAKDAAKDAPADVPADGAVSDPAAEPHRRLGEKLVAEGLVHPDDVTLAVLEQHVGDDRRIGEILVEHGAVDATTLHEVLEGQGEDRRSVADSSVRVDVDVLDNLMRLVGELLLTRNQVAGVVTTAGDLGVTRAWQRLTAITAELQDGVIKARMQPLESVWNKLPRMVRDLANAMGKRVELELLGGETELDRSVLEAVKDPITHLVRNALDHGIERPEKRSLLGKAPVGRLTLRASHEGGKVRLDISDDGAGIDPARIAATAISSGLLTQRQAATMTAHELVHCIFLPGFSTAERITNVSGRGVGMDVVKTNLERIGGSVEVTSAPGTGTTFRVTIPLTLAIVSAIVVTCDGQRYAVPQSSVLELVRLSAATGPGGLETIAGAPVHRLRGELLPVVPLRQALGMLPAQTRQEDAPRPDEAGAAAGHLVVVGTAERRFGLLVDDVVDTEDIVVKPLSQQLKGIDRYAGAAILSDGRVALILDVWSIAAGSNVAGVVRSARHGTHDGAGTAPAHNDDTSLLMVRLDDDRLLAIPLANVTRLEEVPVTRLERVGNREALQYHGGILSIARLSTLVAGASRPDGETVRVVVYTERGRSVGLVVAEILDVAEEPLDVVTDIDGPGVAGTTVVGQRVMELLDVRAAILAADPHFHDGATESSRIDDATAGA